MTAALKRRRLICAPRLLLVACSAVLAASAGGEEGRLRASFDEQGVRIAEGTQTVFYYQRAIKSKDANSKDGQWPRANYLHPVHDLKGGVITEDFPEDHGHHRGIFWAWHQVWLGDQKLGDPWICERFVWDVQSVKCRTPGKAIELETRVVWKSPDHQDATGRMIPLVRESALIRADPAQASYRTIDFKIDLRALLGGVRIGGSEDVKGYGGFSPRIKLSKDQRFLSAAGEIEPTVTSVEAAGWINIAGDDYGMVMIAHPSNPSPSGDDRWILRRRRSMQNAVFPGREPVELSTSESTILKYRIVIHDGSLDTESIESLSAEFGQRWR